MVEMATWTRDQLEKTFREVVIKELNVKLQVSTEKYWKDKTPLRHEASRRLESR